MCWVTAWTFRCTHVWTVQSGACANPFTPSCKMHETRTVIPEVCRECRLSTCSQIKYEGGLEEEKGGEGGKEAIERKFRQVKGRKEGEAVWSKAKSRGWRVWQ